jgi:hypothetical protein
MPLSLRRRREASASAPPPAPLVGARPSPGFVVDPDSERRRDEERRQAVEEMLIDLTDPDERAAFLASVRGQSVDAPIR